MCGAAPSMTNTDRPAASWPVTTRRTGFRMVPGCRSHLPFDHHAPDLGNGLGRIEMLRACLGAIHDGVTAVEAEGIFEIVEALAGRFVAAVLQPSVGLQKRGGPEKTLAVPPIARTGRRATRAQNALIEPIELLPVLVA